MTDRYVLFGNPVEHSPSPRVHAAFAAQTGQDMTYDRLLVPLGSSRRRRARSSPQEGAAAMSPCRSRPMPMPSPAA